MSCSALAFADSINLSLKLKAIDLSEDFAPGSSYNDEVFLLVYKKQINQDYPIPLLREFFVLDTLKKTKTFSFKTDTLLSSDTIRLVLIEQDTRKQLKAVDAICRVYFKEIMQNKNGRYEFLDDDDLLGITEFNAQLLLDNKIYTKKFETLNLFDWAVYKVEFVKKE